MDEVEIRRRLQEGGLHLQVDHPSYWVVTERGRPWSFADLALRLWPVREPVFVYPIILYQQLPEAMWTAEVPDLNIVMPGPTPVDVLLAAAQEIRYKTDTLRAKGKPVPQPSAVFLRQDDVAEAFDDIYGTVKALYGDGPAQIALEELFNRFWEWIWRERRP